MVAHCFTAPKCSRSMRDSLSLAVVILMCSLAFSGADSSSSLENLDSPGRMLPPRLAHSNSKEPDESSSDQLLRLIELYLKEPGWVPEKGLFSSPVREMQALTFTTPAYQKEALKLIIAEANQVARDLHLQETLPITESNLVAAFIPAPGESKLGGGGLGNITTSNYLYNNSDGNKFTDLDYVGPMAREPRPGFEIHDLSPTAMGTSYAYQSATQILSSISTDVAALNRDCRIQVASGMTRIPTSDAPVPLYGVYWMPKDPNVCGCMAEVMFAGPNRFILQVDIDKPQYILSPPLVITNLAYVFSPTNPVNVAYIGKMHSLAKRRFDQLMVTNALVRKSVEIEIREASRIAAELHLPESLPILSSNLTVIRLYSPAKYGQTNIIGSIATTNYSYNFLDDNGLYLQRVGAPPIAKFALHVDKMEATEACRLAERWMRAISINVDKLNRDCRRHVKESADQYEGENGSCLPRDWVYWTEGWEKPKVVASVEVYVPSRALVSLRVRDPKYILRKPLVITNLSSDIDRN